MLLELYNGSAFEYIVRIDGDDFVSFLSEADELLKEEEENVSIFNVDLSLYGDYGDFFSNFLYDQKKEINSLIGIGYFEDSLNIFNPVGTADADEGNTIELLKFMDECAAEVGDEFRYPEPDKYLTSKQ